MRIGLVTGEYPPMQGGVGAYTRILAQTLADQDHQVFVLSSTQAREDDTRVQLSPSVDQWGIGALNAVRHWAQDKRLDIVNIQYQTAAFAMSPWIHFIPDAVRQTTVITTFHDLRYPYLFPKAGRLRNWIVMRLARSSDGAIVTNHEDRARLHHLPCTVLIPIGSNVLQPLPSDFDPRPWRTQAGAKEGDLLLAFFGLVNRSKRLNLLLDALASLRGQNVPARLLIIGGGAGSSDPTNAGYQAEIQAQMERLQMTSFVHSTGFVDEESVGRFLAAGDIVVLPFEDGASYRRGSLMAAIRYGCSIVTTQPMVSIPSFVDGANMLLVPRQNAEAMTNAILRLYHDDELGLKLRQGAKQLSTQFEWSHIARETSAFYERVRGARA
jgi:glycosyltransferase involved in cell wall biosynthesis